MEILTIINMIGGALLGACMLYQWIYVLLDLIKKPVKFEDAEPKKYAVLIAGRNEEKVIGTLLDSINKQKYPADLIDTYVVADNCTDKTAEVARAHGATVYERFNKEIIGKGFALDELIKHIWSTVGQGVYDGYIIFDADNLLDENYVAELNKTVASGYRIVTSYRNSKNYGDNWISAGCGMWFLRDYVQLSRARMMLDISSTVSGTGFYIAESIVIEDGGFISETMSEDTELSARWMRRGEPIGFCEYAEFYDEQPTKFSVFFHQRTRWSKGYVQNIVKHGPGLVRSVFRKRGSSCLDMIAAILPPLVVGGIMALINIGVGIYLITQGRFDFTSLIPMAIGGVVIGYFMTLLMGVAVLITERHHIRCPISKQIGYVLLYPFYMLACVPAVVYGLFAKVTWKPIEHTSRATIEDMMKK